MNNENNAADELENRQFTALGMPGAAGPDAEPEKPTLTNEQTITGAVKLARDVFCNFTMMQSPQRTLNDATAEQLGKAWGPVLDKHNIDLQKYMSGYELEVSAIICTVSIAISVRSAAIAEIAMMNAARNPAPEQPIQEAEIVG